MLWRVSSIFSLVLLPGPLCPGVVITVRVPSVCQIGLFKNYLYSIEPSASKANTLNQIPKYFIYFYIV